MKTKDTKAEINNAINWVHDDKIMMRDMDDKISQNIKQKGKGMKKSEEKKTRSI